jgi:hypothetical protein
MLKKLNIVTLSVHDPVIGKRRRGTGPTRIGFK